MKKGKEGNRKRNGFSRDDKGVSSVLGVVLLISIVVVITSVIAAFVFGAVTGNKQSPCAELVVKDAVADNQNITIVHYGGDGICVYSGGSGNIEIKYNGRVCNLLNNASLNGQALSPATNTYFNLGDELEVNVTYGATGEPTRKLTAGDSICIVYTPADCILQRVTVVSL